MKAELFRSLDETEEQEFRQWARDNFKVTDEVKSIWHPSIQDECCKMIREQERRAEEYNGWANWETWNVALWIGNDELLYNFAKLCHNYKNFVELVGAVPNIYQFETGDGVAWKSQKVKRREINSMIKEL